MRKTEDKVNLKEITMHRNTIIHNIQKYIFFLLIVPSRKLHFMGRFCFHCEPWSSLNYYQVVQRNIRSCFQDVRNFSGALRLIIDIRCTLSSILLMTHIKLLHRCHYKRLKRLRSQYDGSGESTKLTILQTILALIWKDINFCNFGSVQKRLLLPYLDPLE